MLTNGFFSDIITNVPSGTRITKPNIADLCKGSTADSDSVCEGSNPSSAANKKGTFVYQTKVPFLNDVCLRQMMLGFANDDGYA